MSILTVPATVLSAVAALASPAAAADVPSPVIDVHVHAHPADGEGPPPIAICTPVDPMPAWDPAQPYGAVWMDLMKNPPCDDPIWSPEDDETLRHGTIAVMRRHNVYGVLSGSRERVKTWMDAEPGRFLAGYTYQVGNTDLPPEELRAMHAAGQLDVLAEITNQYVGVEPDDPRMSRSGRCWRSWTSRRASTSAPGRPVSSTWGAAGYRARLHSPLTLEEVLVRHPRLRLYVMHAGYPMLDDMLAVLYAHPQVYVGIGVIVYTQPREGFYRYLKAMVDAGFGNRIMFGSDQMVWPEAIERSIRVIEEAPFLDGQQKRDILYNNAARFLRLSDEEIARHRRGGKP